jgi:hypothetical protein
LVFLASSPLAANGDEPAVSYIFPAGGQQGTQVHFRVGGMYLHEGAALEMLGPGMAASPRIAPTETIWFEGPLLPLPASQQKEDYPKDYSGQVEIAADAPLGTKYWRISTSQGATPSMKFVVGRLPEVVEQEIDGEPVPVAVTLPLTINGRIFPREDIDDWAFTARRGELIYAEVLSARLGLPLEARLVLYDNSGKPLAEDVGSQEGDARLHVTIPEDGAYRVRIHDVNFGGLQNFVYRLTITTGPKIERLYPLGGRRGSTLRLECEGFGLGSGSGLPPEPTEVAIPSDAPSWFVPRLPLATEQPVALGLEIDDVTELLESEPNNSREQAASLSAPSVCNGRIGVGGDIDYWAFSAKGGETLDLAISAARLGSSLDPVLAVEDAAGKQLAGADESPSSQSDARLPFTAPSDGTYYVRVADRFASRGGSAFAYRLKIAPPGRPDFRLKLASDALTLHRGGETRLRLTCERLGGFTGAVKLAVEGLPAGVTMQGAEIPISLKADAAARIETAHLKVSGTAEVDGQPLTRTAALAARPGEIAVDNVLLAVSMPTPFKVVGKYDLTFAPRGSQLVRHYAIDRGGFTGKLTVQLADRQARHLQGVTGPAVVVPPASSDCDYPVFLPSWMELGRTSRSVVMAVGVVTDAEGREHTVSFSSQNQNEQIVALVSPGELSVQAEHSSLACSPASEVAVRVRLARGKSLTGPAKVELIVPRHMQGISADAVAVPPEVDGAELRVRCAAIFGPLNMPLTIRATSLRDGRQVVAETKLQLVSDSGKP